MKKILLTAVCAAALATPALAGSGWGGNGGNSGIEQSITIDQIGINNGALAIQNGATGEMEFEDGAFSDVETGLDLGEMEFQNVNWIVGDGSIDRVQNINDDIDGDAINGDTESELEFEIGDVTLAWNGGMAANKGGENIEVEIEDIDVAVDESTITDD